LTLRSTPSVHNLPTLPAAEVFSNIVLIPARLDHWFAKSPAPKVNEALHIYFLGVATKISIAVLGMVNTLSPLVAKLPADISNVQGDLPALSSQYRLSLPDKFKKSPVIVNAL